MARLPRLCSINLTGRARDSQRQKVYEWGWAMEKLSPVPTYRSLMSLEDAEAYVAKVWADYRSSPPPRVVDGRGRAKASGSMHRIALPKWARQPATILHELAHGLTDAISDNHAWHGPEYARCLLERYARYLKVPKRAALELAANYRVKIAAVAACPQPLDREEKRLSAEVSRLRAELKTAETALRAHRDKKRGV